MAEGGERDLLPVGRLYVDVAQVAGIGLKLRPYLQHHVILVELREDGRDLALSKSVIERVINGLRQNAKTRGRIAINHQIGLQAAVLLVAGYITQLRQSAQPRHNSR